MKIYERVTAPEGRVVHQGERLEMRIVPLPAGDEVLEKEIVVHGGAVVILPILTTNSLVMIKNERLAVGRALWELPAGTLGPDEEPADCALRELQEETGYQAGKLEYLGRFFSSPGWSNHCLFVFLARALTPGEQQLEKDENISVHTILFPKLRSMIEKGDIVDAKTLAVFAMYSVRCGGLQLAEEDKD